MGTTWSVRLVSSGAAAHDYEASVAAELAALTGLFSHWDPDSELSRYNRAPRGLIAASPSFLSFLERCLGMAQATAGAVDPTLGTLVDLWGFGPPGPRSGGDTPSQAELDTATASSGWTKVRIEGDGLYQPGGLRLDLSGLAKGYAVDRVSHRLDVLGASNHLVEIGGEVIGRGVKPDGQPWWVELETCPANIVSPRAALCELAVATSGNAYRSLDIGGRRCSHTLDPRTGQPVANGVTSVTVFAETGFDADAWATALTVMGPEVGTAKANRQGLAACFIFQDDGRLQCRTSTQWDAMAGIGA